ncbi:MAG: DUF3089 domain-containing protein [Bacteroidota bacterium]
MMLKRYSLLCLLFALFACKATYRPQGAFSEDNTPPPPDYGLASNWAALPSKADPADRLPDKSLQNRQADARPDVFFLHPTTYTQSFKGADKWNAPIDDPKLNEATDESTILHQASIFNGAGRVFAPRYRQAHIYAYFTKSQDAKEAFQLAYQDVKAAFTYYLEHYNEGRPIILAAHSQGTTHAGPILREFFDGTELQDQLIAAYLVGMPVRKDYFKNIPPCESPEQFNCFCSWRSWERGYYPPTHDQEENILVTNPLIWTTDTTYAPKALNKGTVLRKFNRGFKKGITDAQVHQNILWINKPKFFGSIFIKFKNYHVADYNLFYVNIRENAEARAKAWLDKHP